MPTRHPLVSLQIPLVLLFILLQAPSLAQNRRPLEVLQKNKVVICDAAKIFQIPSRLIASVIYVEHAKNVSWMDRDIDPLLAQYGLNVSLGLGQVKINTALWIEKSLHDSSSRYFLGLELAQNIPCSASREELVARLQTPAWNARYIAAYLAMIRHRWKIAQIDIDDKVDIAATLYSAGVVEENQEKRPPHKNPISNTFGKLAKDFYDSTLMQTIF